MGHSMELTPYINGSDNNHLSLRRIVIFFCAVFVFTLLEGLLVRQYLLPHVFLSLHDGLGFMAGGDSKGYHAVAVELAEKINAHGWSAWELRPNAENTFLATPSGIASILYALFGDNPLFLLPFNAAVHAATATLLLMTMHALFANGSRRVAIIATIPFVLFPTAISWTSQLLRDGIFILGAILYLWGWVSVTSERNATLKNFLWGLFFTLSSILIVWAVRSYMMEVYVAITVIVSLTITTYIIFQNYQKMLVPSTIKRLFTAIVFGMIVMSALTLLASVEKYSYLKKAQEMSARFANSDANMNTASQLSGKQQDFVDHERPNSRCKERWIEFEYAPALLNRILKSIIMAREGYYGYVYRNAGSTIDQKVCLNSASDLMLYLPRALQIALLAPFPNQWFDPNSHGQGASRKIAGAEMVVTYIALLGLICLGASLRKKIELWIVMSCVLPLLLLLSVVTPNLGALHRQRYGFLLVLVGIGLGLIAQYVLSKKSPRVFEASDHG
jgi:hypothetical protein